MSAISTWTIVSPPKLRDVGDYSDAECDTNVSSCVVNVIFDGDGEEYHEEVISGVGTLASSGWAVEWSFCKGTEQASSSR